MKFLVTTFLNPEQKEALLKLWNKEYPLQLAYSSLSEFEAYLAGLENTIHTLLIAHNQMMGWYFEFDREGERWFAMLLDSSLHGQGLGTELLNRAKSDSIELNAWVVDHNRDKKPDGSTYRSPLNFYIKNGFKVLHNERLEIEKISAVQIKWIKPETDDM